VTETYAGETAYPGEAAPIADRGMVAAEDADSSLAAIGEMTSLLVDTRGCLWLSGGLLAAGALGLALAVATWPAPHVTGYARLCCLGLLPVMLSWVRAAILLVLAGRPVADVLSELRWRTGAPVDPSAPWVRWGTGGTARAQLGWDQARALISAAYLGRSRAQLAIGWAVVAVGGLCVWTAATLAIAVLA
jgi:hypothetical protein